MELTPEKRAEMERRKRREMALTLLSNALPDEVYQPCERNKGLLGMPWEDDPGEDS